MSKARQMSVSITEHQDELVRGEVESGRFNSASEVVREALRLFELRGEQQRRLRALIEEGTGSGAPTPLDMDEIIREARARRETSPKNA